MSHQDGFDYNAPQFVDFENLENYSFDKNAERYFGTEDGSVNKTGDNSTCSVYESAMSSTIKEEPLTPQSKPIEAEPSSQLNSFSDEREDLLQPLQLKSDKRTLRRSSSLSALNIPKSEIQLSSNNMDNAITDAFKNLNISSQNLHVRSSSRDDINYSTGKRKPDLKDMQPRKYISMAEKVLKFQCGTPDRFRSRPRTQKPTFRPLSSTIPQSPALATKTRIRPVHTLSQEEKEELELEEMKKMQFKAHGINKGVPAPTSMGVRVERKPITKPEPFKLTEIKKKPIEIPKTDYKFVAQPVPTKILERVVGIKPVPKISLTEPRTPKITRVKCRMPSVSDSDTMSNNKAVVDQVEIHHSGIHKLDKGPMITKIKPFSFETRDIEMIRKREDKIKQYIEEEKKLREFHAKPVPQFKTVEKSLIYPLKSKLTKSAESLNSVGESEKSKENAGILFKAQPAIVLKKKPFRPLQPEHKPVEFNEFNLYTDRRAKEREEFEKKLKDRELILEENRKQHEEEQRRREEEEIQRLRKGAIPKANPIRQFKEFQIQPSNIQVTSPKTPKFSTLKSRAKTSSN